MTQKRHVTMSIREDVLQNIQKARELYRGQFNATASDIIQAGLFALAEKNDDIVRYLSLARRGDNEHTGN